MNRSGSIIFCSNCGSALVDVCGWLSDKTAILRCSECGNQTHITGFTVGRSLRLNPEALADAMSDKAGMKFRKRG